MLSKGYGEKSATQLVGNRYRLNARQQKALGRMSVGESAIQLRQSKKVKSTDLVGETVAIDGFNLLILLESAMSGAYVFKGLDGVYRDISGVHDSYKRVQHSEKAIELVGHILNKLGVKKVDWLLDKPVSNSGRLKVQLLEIAATNGYDWAAELVFNPDKALAEHTSIVISADGWVLDRAERWFNMAAYLLEQELIMPRPPIIFAK